MENEREKFYTLLTVLVLIFFFVLPSVFGDEANPWLKYLNKWQTIIAGFLALAAAFLTVKQMRISDRNADKKHAELVRLQTHRDSLVVERAVTHWLNVFENCSERLEKIGAPETPKEGEAPDTRKYLQCWLAELSHVKAKIKDSQTDPHWTTASPLFPGQLSFRYGSICNLFGQENTIKDTKDYLVNQVFYERTPIHSHEAEYYKINFQICENMRNKAIQELEGVVAGVRELATIYNVAGGN